jgi:hypothetical protein
VARLASLNATSRKSLHHSGMKTLLVLMFAAACGGTTTTPAEPGHEADGERVHEGGHVKLWVPAGWAVEGDADSLVMTAPDHSVSLEVTVIDAKDLGTALLAIGAAALVGYDHLELVGAPQSGDINGMAALFQDGHATYHGTPVDLSVGVVDTPAEKFLLVVGEGETDRWEQHEGTIREVMHRIRPI